MARRPFDGTAQWIWCAGGVADPPNSPESPFRTCYFRRTFDAPADATLDVAVSADTRYVLWCNGEEVRRGPGKGDVAHQFYDELTLDESLREGENVLAALVVSYAPSWEGPTSRMTAVGGFALDGVLRDGAGERVATLHTDGEWEARPDAAYGHVHRGTRAALAGQSERVDGRRYPHGWRTGEDDPAEWAPATEIEAACRRDDDHHWHRLPHRLVERPIPELEDRPERFAAVHQVEGVDPADVDALRRGKGSVTVPAGESARFVLEADALTTGYPVLDVAGGTGGSVSLTYSEAWHVDGEKSWRDDPERGEVVGHRDAYVPGGGEERYVPVRWRAFRLLAVELEADEELTVEDLSYRFTAYPFEERASFASSEARHDRVWEKAWRTVRLCAHETFEDCPYYEQLQYAGDTQPVMRYAGYVSGDWRLARQAVHQFDWSRDYTGLTKSRYPSRNPQHIPSWSLLWVLMVRDYWWHTGDAATARDVLDGVDAALEWFADHETDAGVVADLSGWRCVDWVDEWDDGVPPGARGGVSTIINLALA